MSEREITESVMPATGSWNAGKPKPPLPAPMGSAWILVSDHLPELGQMVWLHEEGRTWIGSRDDTDGDGWIWGNSYGHIWHNGMKWDGDCEQDDDYKPTHWMQLPTPPNSEITRAERKRHE